MLRIPAVIAVLGLSALTLAACASAPANAPGNAPGAASCDRVNSDSSIFDVVHASGGFGTPETTLDAPVNVDATTVRDETVGEGLRVTSDDQDVFFSVSIVDGASGKAVAAGSGQIQSLTAWRENYAGLADAMMCATEGSRVVAAIPASDLSAQAAESWGVAADQSIVVTLDLTKVYLAAADGASQYNDRRGMPSVVLAPNGRPGVIIPDAAAPADLTTETLKKGAGAEVTAQDSVRVQYTAVDWATRKVTSSTWENGTSQAVTTASPLPFAGELLGATVGSQLLVVAPPTSAGGSATAYVVDILGIDPAAAAG